MNELSLFSLKQCYQCFKEILLFQEQNNPYNHNHTIKFLLTICLKISKTDIVDCSVLFNISLKPHNFFFMLGILKPVGT